MADDDGKFTSGTADGRGEDGSINNSGVLRIRIRERVNSRPDVIAARNESDGRRRDPEFLFRCVSVYAKFSAPEILTRFQVPRRPQVAGFFEMWRQLVAGFSKGESNNGTVRLPVERAALAPECLRSLTAVSLVEALRF